MWEFPNKTRRYRLQIEDGAALWPTEEWLRQILDAPVDVEVVHIQFHFLEHRGERHPELKRHAAQITIDGQLPAPSQATARCDVYSRHLWELDTLILASLIAILKSVLIEVGGLVTELDQLWQDLLLHKSANAYLARMCHAVKDRIRLVNDMDMEDVIVWSHLLPPQHVVDQWNNQFVIAGKMQRFYEKFLDCYPLAHQVSRQHGQREGCVRLCPCEAHEMAMHKCDRDAIFVQKEYVLANADMACLMKVDGGGFLIKNDICAFDDHFAYAMEKALKVALLLWEIDVMLNLMTVRSQGLHFFSRLSSSIRCLERGVILMTVP